MPPVVCRRARPASGPEGTQSLLSGPGRLASPPCGQAMELLRVCCPGTIWGPLLFACDVAVVMEGREGTTSRCNIIVGRAGRRRGKDGKMGLLGLGQRRVEVGMGALSHDGHLAVDGRLSLGTLPTWAWSLDDVVSLLTRLRTLR